MGERKSILLRLDPSVHDALAHWAADELRSTNAQIEFLLRRALTDAGRSSSPKPIPRRGRPRKQPGVPGTATNEEEEEEEENADETTDGARKAQEPRRPRR